MGEYLDLISNMTDEETRRLLQRELGDLAQQLDVLDGRISTKLATCEEVFFTFEEMKQLYTFIQEHNETLRYGPRHEHNATPKDILKARTSLYLGAWENHGNKKKRVALLPELAGKIEHRKIWRKTKKVCSKNGKWYYRKLRPEETSGVRGDSNGHQVPCPNHDRPFRAVEVGFAWDATTNKGRTLYECPPCGRVFNMGEFDTPQHSELAGKLR